MSRVALIHRVAGFYPGDTTGDSLPGEVSDDPQDVIQLDNLTREVQKIHKYIRQRGMDATALRMIRALSKEHVPYGASRALLQSLELLALQEIQQMHLLEVLARVGTSPYTRGGTL